MAKAAWLTATPTEGSGDGSVSFSATPHTGRKSRSTTATFKATGVADKTVTINQAGASEGVKFTKTSFSVPKSGGRVALPGTSNSSKLTFSTGSVPVGGSTELTVILPTDYTAAGTETANGASIAGDPGATANFDFEIGLTFSENTTTKPKARQIIVTAAGGQTSTCTLTQPAGDPTLSVTPTTLSLVAAGTAQSVSVTSNTNWTVE